MGSYGDLTGKPMVVMAHDAAAGNPTVLGVGLVYLEVLLQSMHV